MILVFGKSGQVATELARDASVHALGRADLDLTEPVAAAKAKAGRGEFFHPVGS